MDFHKFQDLYRIESTRLINWDYSCPGWYFITICTKDKQKYFGEVINNVMQLSKIGKIVERCWIEIPEHFENCKLREFVVMPNHVHGVIDVDMVNPHVVNNPRVETRDLRVSPQKLLTKRNSTAYYEVISSKSNQLIPKIIRGFKTATINLCIKESLFFFWQPRFYDHIARDENSLYFIEEYIRRNPENWKNDRNYLCEPNA